MGTAIVRPKLITLDSNDNSSNWTGTDGPDSFNEHIQGTNSESWNVAKNQTETGTWSDGSSHDMSAPGTHFLIWFKTNLTQYYTSVTLEIESTAGNYKSWVIAEQGDGWGGGWKCFIVDLDKGAPTGTLARNNVNTIRVIVNNSSSGNIRAVINTWIDAMRYGTGIDAWGIDIDFNDITSVADNETNKYGVISKENGIFLTQGTITVGDTGGQNCTFNSTNEVLVWKEENVGNDLYKVDFVGTGTAVNIDGMVMLSPGTGENTRPDFFATGGLGSFTMAGSTILGGALLTFKAGQSITSCKFDNCGLVDPSTAVFDSNTISNCYDVRALNILDANIGEHNIANCIFTNNSTATWYQFTGEYIDDGGMYTNNFYDVENSSAGLVTINAQNGSNVATSSGNVQINNSVSLDVYTKDANNRALTAVAVAIYRSNNDQQLMNEFTTTTTAGSFITGVTYTILSIGTTDFTAIGASSNTVGVTFTATGPGTGDGTATDGHASEAFNYSGDVPIYIKARKSSTGSTRYFPFRTTGTITNAGFSLNAILNEDDIAST